MKRTLIAVAALVGLASAANAATLTITQSGSGTYTIGQSITLTITGDSQGESALNVTGFLDFTNSAVVGNLAGNTQSQNTLHAFGSVPWTPGALNACAGSSCKVFDQLGALGLSPSPASDLLVATLTLTAGAAGTSVASWNTNQATGTALQFFSLSNAAGTSITVVPEPTTAALLGLGLFGLAVSGRRR
jgi:opacity protein-like surface antigen